MWIIFKGKHLKIQSTLLSKWFSARWKLKKQAFPPSLYPQFLLFLVFPPFAPSIVVENVENRAFTYKRWWKSLCLLCFYIGCYVFILYDCDLGLYRMKACLNWDFAQHIPRCRLTRFSPLTNRKSLTWAFNFTYAFHQAKPIFLTCQWKF